MFNSVTRCTPMLHKWSTNRLKWTQMTLAISTLKTMFLLQERHLGYPTLLLTLNIKTSIFFHFKKLSYLG